MPLGKHYGSFAGGFAKSFTEMMKLWLMQQHYDALNKHYAAQEELWAGRGQGKGFPKGTYEAGAAAGREWDRGGGGGGGAYDGGPKAEAHAQEMAQYLQDKWGLSKAGAAGVVGNAWQESRFASNFNPGGDKGTAAGMFQWRDTGSGSGARQTNARNYMAQNGLNPNDWRSHLDAAMDETKRDYPSMFNQLRTTDDPQYATHEFFHVFERGDPKQANFANRDGMAQAALGGKPTATTTKVAKGEDKTPATKVADEPATPTKGPGKGKTPTAKTASADDGSYQVAGLNDVALTPEQAAKSRADLEAHRAAPGDDRGLNAEALNAASPSPPPGAGPASTIPGGSSVDAQATAPAPSPSTAIPPGPTVDAQNYDRTMGPPERTGAPPNVGITPSSVPDRPVMGPPQRTGAPPTIGPTPSSAPPPVQGPVLRADDGSRPDLTARGTQMGPEGGGATELPPEWSHMPAPGARDPKGVYAPKPTPLARDTGARPDLTARSPGNAANVPSKDATPASSPALPSTPTGNTGDVPGTVRYEVPNSSASRAPIITTADLSHLWGANPPLSQRAPTPAPTPQVTPQSNPRQNDWSDVASAPAPDDIALGMQLGAAKGGAIPSRATMKFAGGGLAYGTWNSPTSTTYVPPSQQPIMGVNTRQLAVPTPDPSMAGYQPWSRAEAAKVNDPTLTPDQKSWYQQQIANATSQGGSYFYNPASMPTTPTPTAPTTAPASTPAPPPIVQPSSQTIVQPSASNTINDPTTQTSTGAPGLPTAIQAKSYDPNVDAQTGAGFANSSNIGGTNYSVGSDDQLKANSQGQISGNQTILSRKGGGIPARPMTRFAAGGGASLYGPGSITSPAYSGPTTSGGWVGTPLAQMAPNQQAWATQQQALIGARQPGGGLDLNTLSMTPDAIWPTPAAPAAPTTVNQPLPTAKTINQPITDTTKTDPTTGTMTGAPYLPNSIQAKSYDPNVDAQTGAGFTNTSNQGGTNYSVGSDDQLKTNNQNQIAGSRKGGPITRRVTTRYDDGGGVSPSAAGMPPGLGGQQAIPPIYYNPATYAPAGAPVGKGVTQTNANTFSAGAIPSLPMARGGVVAFDDGGEVSADIAPDYNEERQTAQDDQMTTALLNQRDAASAPTTGAAPVSYFTPADVQAPGTSQQGPPPGLSPATPELSDGQGNPSKGLIAAIGDGLHWLGDHLGLVGGAQAHPAIAGNPQTQDNRSNFAQGNTIGGMDHDAHKQIATMIDPNGTLNDAERNIAVMEGSYRFLLTQGDTQNASKMAASILQYSVQVSRQYANEAAKQLYDGNLQGAVDNINHASDAIPDGRLTHVTLNKDGTAIVTAKGLDGRTLWQQHGSAEAILQYATNRGRTGQMQWDALEEQAAKYDPTFAAMAKNRTANIHAQTKEDADTAAQTAANEQISKLGPQFTSVDQPGAVAPASAPTAPAIPRGPPVQTASTQGAPPTSDGRGAATPNAPPQTADSNAPPVALGPSGVTGHGGALPSAPGADIPTADVQDVDLEHDVGYQNIVTQTTPKYFTSDGRPIVGTDANGNSQAMARPPTIDEVTLKSYAPQVQAAYRERWQQYQAAVQQNQASMRQDIDGQRRDYSANLVSQRTAGSQAHSDASRLQVQAHADAAAAKLEENRQRDAAATRTANWTREDEASLTPTQREEVYKGSSPMAVTASLPRYAVTKSDGTLDENASAQALGKAYDLPPPGGGAATGGLQRATTVSNIASDAVTWNTHMGTGDVHDLVDGLARGVYTTDGKPTPVIRRGQQLDQFVVHQNAGDPGVTLLLPRQDGYNIARIKQEFADAQPKTTPTAPASPAAPPPRALPGPTKPDFWSGGRPQATPGPSLKLPEWVPPNQIPPDQRQLYPELSQ